MKTYSAKPTDVVRKWYVLDATELPLGRLATQAATLLTGKSKPQYTKHIDCGDFVIVINASNLVVTGNKQQDKTYYRHSGFPGGLKARRMEEVLQNNPTEVITKAIRGMLPVNKLRSGRLLRLKVYADSEHPHNAQSPTIISLKKGVK